VLRLLGTRKLLCDGVTRRDFLQIGGISALGLGLAQHGFAASSRHAESFGRAKACILVFPYGSPSSHETFDPKPDAPLEIRGPLMIADRYDEPTMKCDVYQKDIDIIGEFAAKLHCPTPLFDASRALYSAALAQGRAKQDTAAVCAVLKEMAGLSRAVARPAPGLSRAVPRPAQRTRKSTSTR
jgi:hypothetical protein